MHRLAVVLAALACLVLPTSAAARVRLVSVTSPIAHGAYATLTVSAAPSATCSIVVHYRTTDSTAKGLYPKRGARISWTWKVGTRTTPGRWAIDISCGSAGSLHTSFVVT